MSEINYNIYFQDLSYADPADVCRRSACEYNPGIKAYILSVWDEKYHIYPQESKIEHYDGNILKQDDYLFIVILYYLLNATDTFLSDEWISVKDIPGGVSFFRGPHEIPGGLIVSRFGNDIDGFKKICSGIDGKPLEFADASFSFNILPRVPAAVLLWRGDEEFPAEAKLLFDRTISKHLSLDIIFALAAQICNKIGNPDRSRI